MDTPNQGKIITIIKTDGLIELVDFTESLLGIGLQYRKCIRETPPHALSDATDDYKLFVKEIRPGSIIAELVPFVAVAMPIMVDFNNLAFFSGYLKNAFHYFIGKDAQKPKIDKRDCEDLEKILTPTAKDRGGLFTLNLVLNGDIKDSFKIDHTESNAAQNAIRRYKDEIRKERDSAVHRKVVLNLKQARPEISSRVGDMGVVGKISGRMVKLFYDTDEIKARILLDTAENPFHYLYIVDVEAETVDNTIVLYKILGFHEKFRKPEEIS